MCKDILNSKIDIDIVFTMLEKRYRNSKCPENNSFLNQMSVLSDFDFIRETSQPVVSTSDHSSRPTSKPHECDADLRVPTNL